MAFKRSGVRPPLAPPIKTKTYEAKSPATSAGFCFGVTFRVTDQPLPRPGGRVIVPAAQRAAVVQLLPQNRCPGLPLNIMPQCAHGLGSIGEILCPHRTEQNLCVSW